MWSVLGPLQVVLTAEGIGDDMGEFDCSTRVIKVRPGLHPDTERHTLAHEWAHSILFDTGLYNVLTNDQQEQICDVFATAIVAANLI